MIGIQILKSDKYACLLSPALKQHWKPFLLSNGGNLKHGDPSGKNYSPPIPLFPSLPLSLSYSVWLSLSHYLLLSLSLSPSLSIYLSIHLSRFLYSPNCVHFSLSPSQFILHLFSVFFHWLLKTLLNLERKRKEDV